MEFFVVSIEVLHLESNQLGYRFIFLYEEFKQLNGNLPINLNLCP